MLWATRNFIVRFIGIVFLLWPVAGIPVWVQAVLAQNEPANPEEGPVNPLEIKTPDLLLPNPPDDLPLMGAEASVLAQALDKLNAEAAQFLAAGNVVEAFKTWNRELRLRRYLGPVAEVEALTRVAQIARTQNQRAQVQFISQRLQMIYLEAKAKGPVEANLLQALATAFLTVQVRLPAIEVHQEILAIFRTKQDKNAIESTLKILADLYFGGFEYAEAAGVYEELLLISEARMPRTAEDDLNEGRYLDQLAFLYDETEDFQRALDVRNKILNRYREAKNPVNVPGLKIAMGENLQALGRLSSAAQSYQEAYSLGWAIQQFGRAGEALEKLAVLYESQDKVDAALQVYQALVVVQQRGYDFFGMMNTFDKMGQIHLNQKRFPQAVAAFQRGLELARQLKYQEDYFSRQITEVNRQSQQP
ncbi:hypothetical protein NG798_02740 [Ancylothrix sp. C2]|uniref:hypothetical protein n=1 Tax=Ancylothrix sp. D3o TaxID=2953691 RepID=UPI0021BB4F1D|nr:hypothetical protein [Ancylothrix sp. D3o]MCT7948698.1 hypothetical protein [Ancylothrix sp. D3o]